MDLGYEYPRETVEYVFFKEILVGGAVPTLPMEYTLTRGLGRPLIWLPIEEVDGKFAFKLDGTLPAGDYTVFVRIPGVSLSRVIEAGRIALT